MKLLLKPLQWCYCIYALITFIAIMLLIFPFAILAGFWGRIKGGNMIFRLCMFWADCWFFLIAIRFQKIFASPHDKRKSYIFVTNHISYLDATMIPKAFRQPLRPLGKVEMSKVPVFGFIYRKAIVTVNRNSPKDRTKSLLLLRSILRKGISVLVFPEGTFNMTTQPLKSFYDGAFRLAIETQTPVKPVLFLDAYRRMSYKSLFSLTPGISRILYLDEISVDGFSMKEIQALKEKVYEKMEAKLIEYNAGWRKE